MYNHNLYAAKAQKRYPQEELSPRTLNMLETLIQADLSIERSVYIFFNSKLREVVQLGRLIDELIGIGKSKSEIITVVRNYWIAGEIRYIQEDGFVRVAAQSISSARLMVFRSDLIHINGASGEWINPEVGMNVYFKIKDYLDDGGQFQIDYLCEELPVL